MKVSNEVTVDSLGVDMRARDPAGEGRAVRDALEVYAVNGCLLARGLFDDADLEPIRRDIQRLIELRARFAKLDLPEETDGLRRFDDGFVAMSKVDRKHGAVIFDACRRLLPLHQLSVHPRLVALAKALMKTDVVIASDVKAIRVDHPREDKYLFDWHQDYPYVMDSEDAIVVWLPLHDVDQTNGCLKVAPGSRSVGLLPLHASDLRNRANNKQAFMRIADRSVVDRFPQIQVPVRAGDALVFNTLTLHASQANQSTRARWTAQIRFGNFAHDKAIARDWPGSLRDGSWFDDKHPEYIVNLEELRGRSS